MVDLVDAHGRPRVVVTGMGVKTPAGVDVESLWDAVRAGRGSAKTIERFDPSELPVRFAGEVLDFDPATTSGPKEARRVDRVTQLGFGAAADALDDAGELGADPSRCAVIAATGVGGLETIEENESTFLERGASRVSPFFVPMMMPNATAGVISIRFGCTGPALCIATACAAGANAIGEGVRLIRDGSAEVVVAGAPRPRSRRSRSSAFARMGALSTRNDDPERASRPFDADRDGFVIAEGAGVPRARDARARARARRHDPRRGAGLRPQRRRVPHHRARRPAAPARPRACSSRSTTPGSSSVGHRARERARHVDAAQRRRRGRGDPQGLRRRAAAGHVDQGRHRPHDRRRRRGRSRDQPPVAARRRRAAHRQPRADRRRHRPRRRRGRAASDRAQAGAVELVRVRRPQRDPDPGPGRPRPPSDRGRRPSSGTAAPPAVAEVREIDGRTVSWFSLDGGKHRGAIGTAEGETIERAVHLAVELGMPDRRAHRQLRRRRRRRASPRSTRGAGSPRR